MYPPPIPLILSHHDLNSENNKGLPVENDRGGDNALTRTSRVVLSATLGFDVGALYASLEWPSLRVGNAGSFRGPVIEYGLLDMDKIVSQTPRI